MSARKDERLPGLGPRGGMPRVAAHVDWGVLTLDERDGFVLSRIDGRTSLGDICLLSPFPEVETISIVRALHERGVIEIPGVVRESPPAQPPPRPVPVAQKSHPVVGPSPRHTTPTLGSPFIPPIAPAAPSPLSAGFGPAPKRPITADFVPLSARRPPLDSPVKVLLRSVDDGPADSARLLEGSARSGAAPQHGFHTMPEVEEVDLPAEVQSRVDEMLFLIGRVEPARLLGVDNPTDKKEIRRAYFRLAKEFHPDRYFTRKLGAYKFSLRTVFNALTDAYEELTGEKSRGG